MRPKGVIDGKRVNIPVPWIAAMERRRRLGEPGDGCSRFKRVGSGIRQIRFHNAETRRRLPKGEKSLMPGSQENLLSFRLFETVPQTDTGGQVENTKALERTRVKELGKMVP